MIYAPFVSSQDAMRYLNEITAQGYIASIGYRVRDGMWVVTARRKS